MRFCVVSRPPSTLTPIPSVGTGKANPEPPGSQPGVLMQVTARDPGDLRLLRQALLTTAVHYGVAGTIFQSQEVVR
jgi:hypothetical protein